MNIDPKSLRLFLLVLERGTISGAAEQFHIAPAAVSKRLSDLEQQLGAALIERSNKGVYPTAAGKSLAAMSQRLLDDMDAMGALMRDFAGGATGHVRIAANLSSITQFLPQALSSFMARHPKVRVSLEERISAGVAQAVADNNADLGVLIRGVGSAEVEYYDYRQDELVLLVPATHPLAGRGELAFADTLDFDYVGMHTGSHPNLLLLRAASELERTWRCRVQVTSYDAQCRMIEAGLGIGVLPRSVAESYVQSLGLALCVIKEPWTSRRVALCVRSRYSLSPAARLLMDHLLQN
ncbi:LysR family transcriptional regulator [Alcaligenes faecalis]|uniref:LysR family transcriptional regulator n=3 Tax=Alcaligenes TaxID=507 RepID=A0AAE9H7T7_ALCFA|nr:MULTISPECIES: LysR family transcriptional regulator [Alcaligenes]MDH4866478.1 LysR family transcriptional regulator [Bacillus cereus]KGP03667.1 LysR family transcriptional regulator [Alcaligenes faecalis]MCM2558668.1 LysR family transcriptional regulator [Alcaligenes faecalis]MCM2622741.1 LysR family transcriptional regulator [Alcaligenes faecalis]MCR4144559.1 LysR family transcriptional regulator [Alcaligenes faecalis]